MSENHWKKEFFGEFFGTLVLILLGNGVVAMVVLLGLGTWENINFAWGLAVLFGIYVSGKTSGAHLNPAVSLALACRGSFPWKKFPLYILAQILGAFTAAALVYFNYKESFLFYESTHQIIRGTVESLKTAGVFTTFPAAHVSNPMAFFDQVLGTAILMIIIHAVTDPKNHDESFNRAPIFVALGVVAIGMSFGGNAGYAINPARDFGPRLFAYFAGWGTVVFTGKEFYFWIPIVAPCIGGVLGSYVYKFFTERFLKSESGLNL